jgi:hypothetical protein
MHASLNALNIITEILVGEEYVQIMKLLLMQFSLGSSYFLSLMSKYSLQHPFLRLSPAVLFLNVGVKIPHSYKIMKL